MGWHHRLSNSVRRPIMQIKDRTFIVSGGSSGLGLATTILFLQNGANVSILDLNPPPFDASSQIDTSRILFNKTNVSSTESLQAALKSTLKWTQETNKPLSGAVCSAGIGTAALALPKQDSSATHATVRSNTGNQPTGHGRSHPPDATPYGSKRTLG